jgi:hypothetical protein
MSGLTETGLRFFVAITILAIFLIIQVACGIGDPHHDSALSGAEGISGVAATKSRNMLNRYCISCHNGGSAANWGSVDSDADFLNFAYAENSRIVPGKPDSSEVIRKMKFGPGDESMPPSGPVHSKEDYLEIRSWIKSLPTVRTLLED